jgi:hypothetical protein
MRVAGVGGGQKRASHMTYAKPLFKSAGAAALYPQDHPARRSLSAEQHSLIAAAYDSAAFDISLPTHARAAFGRKADWFRLLARVGEKRQQAILAKQKAESQSNPFGFIAARH